MGRKPITNIPVIEGTIAYEALRVLGVCRNKRLGYDQANTLLESARKTILALGSTSRNDQGVCPWCGSATWAEYVHNGVGMQQVTPFLCDICHSVECGPCDNPRVLRERDPLERSVGFYRPLTDWVYWDETWRKKREQELRVEAVGQAGNRVPVDPPK